LRVCGGGKKVHSSVGGKVRADQSTGAGIGEG
jgi:hypothetical protein